MIKYFVDAERVQKRNKIMNTQLTKTSRKGSFWPLGSSDYNWMSVVDRVFDHFHPLLNTLNDSPYPVDEYWTEDGNLVLEVPLAGYKREDINLSLDGDYLVLKASKQEKRNDVKYVSEGVRKKELVRKWYVNDTFYLGEIGSKFEDGLLTITLPAKEVKKEPKIKNIEIK